MSGVGAVAVVSRLPWSDASAAPRDTSGAPTLPAVFDLQQAMFVAQNLSRNIRSKAALSSAENSIANRERAIGDAREALARAQDEQESAKSKGKWIDALRTVGTVAAVVVGVASVCFSGGASAPAVIALVGVLLSASSSYVADATKSEELGLALALTGAAMSLGAGAYSLLASSGAQAATALSTGQKAVIVTGRLTAASAEVGQGSVTIARGGDEANAIEARADATHFRADAAREQVMVDEAVDTLQAIEASNRRAINSILAVGESMQNARAATISNFRRM